MKIIKSLLAALLAVAMLASCRSSRNVTTEGPTPNGPELISRRPQANALTAKMNLTLESGNKHINLGGTYRLKRDEVVQINLTYSMLFTINVGTLELTPDYILLLDRINKRYCRVRYADVPDLARAGVTFDYMQRIFWGEAEESPTKVLQWNYANWTDFSGGQFPTLLRFTLSPSSASYKSTFDLSSLRASEDWNSQTEVSDKYQPVSLDTVMKALMSVAK